MTPSISTDNVNRRKFLQIATTAGVGSLAFGGAVVSIGCGEKVSFYVSTVVGSLDALLPLLPNASDQIKKAISIANAFDEAYRAGKFEDSVALFTNLGEVSGEIVELAGVGNEKVKLAIALGRVALNAIATILKSQMSVPQVAAKVAARVGVEAQKQKSMIEKMADAQMIEMLFAASKP